jgi:hypothetical protein
MARDWRGRGQAWELEWGGRTWSLDPSGARPGLWVRGAGAGASGIGPLLGLDGLAAVGRHDPGVFPGEGPPGLTVRDGSVEATYQPRGWPGLTVRAAWRPVGSDAVDLEVEAVLADAPGAIGVVRGFEVTVASVLPEPAGSKTRRWVEPRDAASAALSYDGREGDARDLTTLPPADAGRLAPRVIPSPWDDGLSYVEMTRPGEAARRVAEARKVRSVGHTTRYGLFGRDLPPGASLRARLRGVWLLSTSPQSEALDRAEAFERE